jgi:glutaredoxin
MIEAFWVPGCSSCLRMKEFLTTHNVDFEAVNVAEHPERAEWLMENFSMLVPAVVTGGQAVVGLDLKGIADLVGFDYDPPAILPPAELKRRYDILSATACRLVAQLTEEQLQYKSPDRDRALAELACHIGSIMRSFLHAYEDEFYDHSWENPDVILERPGEIIALAQETERMFHEWWDEYGFDDPLDRVITTSWGPRTLHEALERSVWHPMQHTRQLTFFVERLGIEPDGPLAPGVLEGLPLPAGIHAGDTDLGEDTDA